MSGALSSQRPSSFVPPGRSRTRSVLAAGVLGTLGGLLGFSQAALAQREAGPSLTGNEALEARTRQLENQPYSFKSGDFRLLAVPGLGLAWNDNINLSHEHALDDFILSPQLQLDAVYPLTRRNLLRLSLGVGYDQYFQHDEYSGVRLFSGSEFSFDLYVKDFWINLHDQVQYTHDTAGQPDVANSGMYGGLKNTAGLSGTWDLEDVLLTLGYDHYNFVSDSSEFEYANEATELVSAKAGCRFNQRLTAGLEGTVSFTDYAQPVLNNNTGYSAGLYGDWLPGSALEVKPRGGYTVYDFTQTSQVIQAVDENAWYAELEITHAITDAVSYSLSAGHELRLGIQADTVKAWYARPSVRWEFRKSYALVGSFSYENGEQGQSNALGAVAEHYEWYGVGLGLTHSLTSRLALALDYRLTLRSSDIQSREYTQNLIGLRLTYQL